MKSWEEAFDEAEEERKRNDGRKCKGRQAEDVGRERRGKAANGHGGADQQRAKGDGTGNDQGVDKDHLPPLPLSNMPGWDDEPVPEQEWTVHNRIPNQQCVLFSGQGGAGKSTVQLQQSVAHVLGRDWLGTMPKPGPALFVDAEDPSDVVH